MKYTTFILAILFCASPLFAQQPSISYLMCDEAKNQLQIRGSFGIDSGSVTIEDTTLGIVSWSDSLIICNLPDTGKGAGGNVIVKTIGGISSKKLLSIISITMLYSDEFYRGVQGYYGPDWVWYLNWRIDLIKDLQHKNNIYFEANRTSFCKFFNSSPNFPWRDSSLSYRDSSMMAKGFIDISASKISLTAFAGWHEVTSFNAPPMDTFIFHHADIKFDSTGKIFGYLDSGSVDIGEEWYSNINGNILFPPSPKNIVAQQSQSTDPIKIWQESNSLIIHSENSLGETTVALYTIEGRLLSRTKLDISAAGIYTLDVSDVRTRFALLVLQTVKGTITKKILFYP
jgi:hypothetical protein